jgi:hypothetical protein
MGPSRGRVIALPNPEYYHEFDSASIQNALEAARTAAAEQVQVASADVSTLDLSTAQISEVTLQAACISLAVRNRKVCLSLPLGFGSVCLPIPLHIPDGTAASACLSIRTVWGFPTGVCVSVSALGNEVVRKCFP